MPAYRRLVGELQKTDGGTGAAVLDAAKPYLVASLYKRLSIPVLLVTTQPENSRKFYEQLSTWCPNADIKLLPEPEALPYERIASDTTAALERLQALSALAGIAGSDNAPDGSPPLIIASAAAFMQKVAPGSEFCSAGQVIEQGMEIEPYRLLRQWQAIGYRLEEVVDIPGTMSHRGGIIDIYPPADDMPARLEFFGNTIESIRIFDPATQRSLRTVGSLAIGPATELLAPFRDDRKSLEDALNSLDLADLNPDARGQFQREISMLLGGEMPDDSRFYAPLFDQDSLLNYLPSEGILILDEPRNIELAAEDFTAKVEELRTEKLEQGELPHNFPAPFLSWRELDSGIGNRKCLKLTSWGVSGERQWHELDFIPVPNYAGQLPAFIKKTKEMLGKKKRLVFVSHQAGRLSELLGEEDIIAHPLEEIVEVPPPGSLMLVQGLLSGGWMMKGDTCLFTDSEIFGFIKQRRLLKKRPVPHHRLFTDINPGDYVVHIEHGIGRFAGITRMRADSGSGEKEYIVLEYAAGDRLYVPTDQIDRVGRYVGAGEQEPVLSRLGTQEWSRTKRKVKEAVEDIAEDLITLYASREVVPGFSFSTDTVWQQEVEAAFPYVETPDQIAVQRQVKEDMEQVKPMDRLVCGDVGYGKTEVAVRAAFKAVMDGKQVAVLVPTTVLAEQHYSTFSQRLSAFPVKIEVLSRFRTPAQQRDIVKGLANGNVDMCIGTHRLLQKDIEFKELGLLIIDEEQRFGVAHKEYLKQMRKEVDVLTLSATPIPRTLHMSLVGVRDMSVMETPPEERLPIKTYVAEYNEHLIREAVLRELERNGQVFFVHNRVQSIGLTAEKLQAIIPEARIDIGHGQMPEGVLERVMADFIQGESDILVCSSIIQSGLDMPNVNTLIVNQADKFGLTQLHQLRGRVGRGTNAAYAYFLYDKGKRLSPIAETRLRTIVEASELGAGFSIAMKDLEIRGAGTLLGMRQSGHITAVGFNLYCQLLAQAIEDYKSRQAGVTENEIISSHLPPPSIDLPLPAFIPQEYVTDLLTRLELYQKLAKLDSIEQLEPVVGELRDRFGTPPDEVENLLYALRIKVLATGTGIQSIATERGEIVITPFEGMRFEREKLDRLSRDGVRTGVFQIRLNARHLGEGWQRVLEEVVRNIT